MSIYIYNLYFHFSVRLEGLEVNKFPTILKILHTMGIGGAMEVQREHSNLEGLARFYSPGRRNWCQKMFSRGKSEEYYGG